MNCPMCPAGMGWGMLLGWVIGALLIVLLTVLIIRLLRGGSKAQL
jgi:hypothetical protein